jgi:hypothetical protein
MTAKHSRIRVTDWRQIFIHGVQLTLVLLCLGLLIPFGGNPRALTTITTANVTKENPRAGTLPEMVTRAVVTIRRTLPTRYAVRPGDTLAGIAERLYGTVNDWGYLYHVNARLIANPSFIYAGETLTIPAGMPKGYTLAAYAPKPAVKRVTVTVARTVTRPAVVTGGRLSCTGLEQLWTSAGGNPADAFMAAEIAMAESGGNQYATHDDSNGTIDEGLWQINSSNGALATYDAYGNARSAITLSHNGGSWMPWVTFTTGAFRGLC